MVDLRSKVWVMVGVASLLGFDVRGSRGSRSGCDLVLAWPSAGALAGDHYSGKEQFTAPDTPRLAALECPCEALRANGAVKAQGLGELDIAG
jgi:hypothetical protein